MLSTFHLNVEKFLLLVFSAIVAYELTELSFATVTLMVRLFCVWIISYGNKCTLMLGLCS